MEKERCIVLIGEDEEIERVFLKDSLQENFREGLLIYTAKNGLEALEYYKEYHPDIVLMDINMPGLNGLQAIAKMKEEKANAYFIILTSYDYFHYAQEAIRLGVQDFILKPSTPKVIIEAVSQGYARVHMAYNEKVQKSNLIQKYSEIRPMLEKQCLFSIISGAKEVLLQEEFKRLNIIIKEGFCIVVHGEEEQMVKYKKIKQEIEDIGYICLQAFINHMHVNFILSNRKFQKSDMEPIEYILARYKSQGYKVGFGSIRSISDGLAHSYTQAIRNAREYDETEPYQLVHAKANEDVQEIDIIGIGDELLTTFMRQKDDDLQRVIHNCSLQMLNKSIDEIKQIVEVLLDYLVAKLKTLLNQEINKDDLPKFILSKDEIYRNLDAQLYYVLHGLFQPLQALRYQQSSVLVKKAIHYIKKNYYKAISLNDVAKHLQVTPFYVSKLLKQHTGKNFTDIVSAERIEKAKEYLRENQRVKEVAFSVGFQSQSYFAKMFKKIVGITPREYQDSFK